MDLSAVIFVVLALAWAVYLIPKALQHHDELAGERLVDAHSDRVRVLTRNKRNRRSEPVEAVEAVEHIAVEPVEPEPAIDTKPATQRVRDAATPRAGVARGVTRMPAQKTAHKTAQKAAQRRRRVLAVLVLALVAVGALTWFASLPLWAPAVPGTLVILFLVVSRLSVRKAQRRRGTLVEEGRQAGLETPDELVSRSGPLVEEGRQAGLETPDRLANRLTVPGAAGTPQPEREAALADDGSLWDPLPVTLPTYVNKARARRTVRTIELTGMHSSGHDRVDSTVAREAEASTQQPKAPQRSAQDGGSDRRAAGA